MTEIGEHRRGPAAAEIAFEAVLTNVTLAKRELNSWEATWLQAALIMMAIDDHVGALEAIRRCALPPPRYDLSSAPKFTVEDMRAAFAVLKGRRSTDS